MIIELFTFVIVVSVAGYTFTALLFSPGEILDVVPAFFFRITKSVKLMHVFQCEKCFAGQLALWLYPVYFWHHYHIQYHLIVIIFSIFTAHVIGKLLDAEAS